MGRSEATATATPAIVVCSTYNLEWLKKRSAQTRPATALPSPPLLSPVQVQTRPAEQAVSVAEAKRVYLCRSLAVSTTHSVYFPVSLPASPCVPHSVYLCLLPDIAFYGEFGSRRANLFRFAACSRCGCHLDTTLHTVHCGVAQWSEIAEDNDKILVYIADQEDMIRSRGVEIFIN